MLRPGGLLRWGQQHLQQCAPAAALSHRPQTLFEKILSRHLLDTPSTPVCRPDCAGLCPTCGIDLNDGQCECVGPPADPRWAALDILRSDGSGTES